MVLPLLYTSIEQLLQTDGYLTSNPKQTYKLSRAYGKFLGHDFILNQLA
ncbi:hypothetical protein RINTHM_10840 [Richelia intracellularis HM01]|nr:hypothetical protein RINTHM_10840 [Richelia intracellularis HM01]